MCFSTSRVHKLRYWNWDGERIIHESIVKSSRPPIGSQRGGIFERHSSKTGSLSTR